MCVCVCVRVRAQLQVQLRRSFHGMRVELKGVGAPGA